MSAVAKLKAMGSAALEEVLAPIVNAHEQRQQQEAEAKAAETRAVLAKFPRESKELKQAAALVAKCKADEVAAEADYLKAKARTSEAELAHYTAAQQQSDQLRALRRASIAPHLGREAQARLTAAIEFYRANYKTEPAGKASVRLAQILIRLNAMLDGAEDPPSDDVVVWAQQAIDATAAEFTIAEQQYAQTRARHAAQDRAARVLG
jgi:hypothetical protein